MEETLVYRLDSGVAVTDSVKIAAKFGKRHKEVLRAIRSTAHLAQNCAEFHYDEITYRDSRNVVRPMYVLDRDSFVLLAMGFTGREAMRFKAQFIDAFNRMERHIRESEGVADERQVSIVTPAEALLNAVQLLVDHEKRVKAVEEKNAEIERTLARLDDERKENEKKLLAMKLSDDSAPEQTLRGNIVRAVNLYCRANNVHQKDFWHRLYSDLYYIDHIRIDSTEGSSKLDVCEKRGILTTVWNRVCAIIKNGESEKQ